jgi:CRP-like cAMP-binding protein
MLELLNYLQSIHPIPPETQALLGSMLKEQPIFKGKHWLKQGAVCDRIAFIKKGLVRVYFESGSKEVCLWYNRENEVVISVFGFFSQMPSWFAIQAMEDTTVLYLTYQQLQQVYTRQVDFNIHGRKILEHYYHLSEMHVKLLLEQTGKRLEILVSLHPWMLEDERITDKMLAAYIGVSPEYLCRFKNKRRGNLLDKQRKTTFL